MLMRAAILLPLAAAATLLAAAAAVGASYWSARPGVIARALEGQRTGQDGEPFRAYYGRICSSTC
ncbi:MAG: hypothetical protein AVDCRST_MAG67-509 [uncultured Solirubrobacteraceae bacterium]|uniref:Uncharacterized protein n=1 Tax=uncultured Solirubrobacteraceae bacterium TaxID=1162706 RepID=A0A6J4RPG1_9ACTN|nr:MAG: hypothetical protein AVDCRST_MAG67-509 [uncultured Solirubrobacteraceae bacterium]